MPDNIETIIERLGGKELYSERGDDIRALIAAYRKLKKIALRLCHGGGGIVSGALDFPCPKCDSTKGTLLFRAYQKLNDQLAAKDKMIQSWLIEEKAWAETDMQRASDLTAKDAEVNKFFRLANERWCEIERLKTETANRHVELIDLRTTKDMQIENLEARIETRRETIAAQKAEIERRRAVCNAILANSELDRTSLTAADALAKKCIADLPAHDELDTILAVCLLCGKTGIDANVIEHTADCPLAAYTATRKEGESDAK